MRGSMFCFIMDGQSWALSAHSGGGWMPSDRRPSPLSNRLVLPADRWMKSLNAAVEFLVLISLGGGTSFVSFIS